MDLPVFGEIPADGRSLTPRRGAYALILKDGCFGAVEERPGVFFLPGGGIEAGEKPEQALVRELLEELGAGVNDLAPAGQALQYFSTGAENYRMLAYFYRVRIGAAKMQNAQFEMRWLQHDHTDRLFHKCHRWAVRRHSSRPGWINEQES